MDFSVAVGLEACFDGVFFVLSGDPAELGVFGKVGDVLEFGLLDGFVVDISWGRLVVAGFLTGAVLTGALLVTFEGEVLDCTIVVSTPLSGLEFFESETSCRSGLELLSTSGSLVGALEGAAKDSAAVDVCFTLGFLLRPTRSFC